MKLFFCLLGLIIIYLIFIYIQMLTISTTKYELKNSKILKDYTIVHLSDLHCIKFLDNNKSLIKKIKRVNPNIIVVTGDIAMYKHKIENSLKMLEQLKEIAPIYFISGNHDHLDINYDFLKNELINLGINILDDNFIDLKGNINLYGLSDIYDIRNWEEFTNVGNTKEKYLNNCYIDKNKYNILLVHRPYDFDMYSKYFDLVLAGHTHGGQWIFPFLGGFVYPDKGQIFPYYDFGLKENNNSKLIINRGLGGTFKVPRINNRPEIGIIKLKH